MEVNQSSAGSGRTRGAASAASVASAVDTSATIYLDSTTGELAAVSAGSPPGGLQLTTITVAVPGPMSPVAEAGLFQVCQDFHFLVKYCYFLGQS